MQDMDNSVAVRSESKPSATDTAPDRVRGQPGRLHVPPGTLDRGTGALSAIRVPFRFTTRPIITANTTTSASAAIPQPVR